MSKPQTDRAQAEAALKQADRAARKGDLRAAERWSKTAERMAASAEKLAALPPPVDDEENADAIRAELRDRFRRLAEADRGVSIWEMEREAHQNICAEARKTGAPMPPPLRPRPYTDEEILSIAEEPLP